MKFIFVDYCWRFGLNWSLHQNGLRQSVRSETERRTAIRQTIPTKASVEAETSTIINKRLFFNEFHFECSSLVCQSSTSVSHIVQMTSSDDVHTVIASLSPAMYCDSSTHQQPHQANARCVLVVSVGRLVVQCFMSPPTQYRLYGRQFLQVKRPNQQYQSTEGRSTKDKENNDNN